MENTTNQSCEEIIAFYVYLKKRELWNYSRDLNGL